MGQLSALYEPPTSPALNEPNLDIPQILLPVIHGQQTQEETIEEEINNGQLEELIVDGKQELKLIDKYAEWRLWEAVESLNKEIPERQEG